MAATGLALFGFLIVHLAGNLLLFAGHEAFNQYSDTLHRMGALLYVAEIGLIVFFAAHIYSGLRVTRENRAARPAPYMVTASAGGASLASRSMPIGGIILAIFVVTHVRMFKFGDMSGPQGLFGLVMEAFSSPLVVAWYTLAMLALGLHLSHGIASAFQSLGALAPAWRPRMKSAGLAVGWLIALGFTALPIWSFLARARG